MSRFVAGAAPITSSLEMQPGRLFLSEIVMALYRFSLGYSPCPNDTFIFWALATERFPTDPFRFNPFLADVDMLNRKAVAGELEITKISFHALLECLEDYWVLRSGGALGRGCGPLIVARRPVSLEDLADQPIAIPGRLTTAHLLLQATGRHRGERVVMPFDRIMPAVASGDVAAGLVIHEGRFTYPSWGLHRVLDLGKWWEDETGLPLPLGCIVMRRDLGREAARAVEELIRESLLWGRREPERAWRYVTRHAQEMAPEVIRQHIDTFVNEFSMNVGREGKRAVRRLLDEELRLAGKASPTLSIFWDDEP